jgi:hypothetical protein
VFEEAIVSSDDRRRMKGVALAGQGALEDYAYTEAPARPLSSAAGSAAGRAWLARSFAGLRVCGASDGGEVPGGGESVEPDRLGVAAK